MGLSKNWTCWKTRIHKINIINKTDLIYMAGLVDGEGCIGLNTVGMRGKQNLHPQVTIANTNKEVLDWVMVMVGKGRVQHRISKEPKWKDAYHWRINGHFAIQLVKKLLPYLKIKKLQAETLIQFEKTIQFKVHRHKLPEDVVVERNRIKGILTKLNKRGKEICPPLLKG